MRDREAIRKSPPAEDVVVPVDTLLGDALVRSSHDGIAVVDLGGRVRLWSPAMERLLGRRAADCRHRPAASLLVELGVADDPSPLRRALAGEDVDGERRRVRGEGQERVLHPHYIPLRDEEGAVRGALLTVRDISEEALLEDQLRQAHKAEAVGRLAGGVAHDFNNLLTAILGYCELLLLRVGERSDLAADLLQIRRSAESGAALTRQLLAFSRKQVLQPQVLDPNEEIRLLEPMLRQLGSEDVRLTTRLAAGTGRIKVDRTQLQQVMLNLLVNARDAMPGGGRVVVESRNVELDEHYAQIHPGARAGRYVMIAVSDNGVGMDTAVRARIFEPFFTTKERGRGTGLGLAVVYGVVKQSGGYIWVYSEPGRGTTFKLYFPCVDEPASGMEMPLPVARPISSEETILVVEDEDIVRDLLVRLLEHAGYRVLKAASGAEALARVGGSPRIDLLITDVMLPDTDGNALAERLAGMRPELRVLFVSGYTDESIASHNVLDPGVKLLEKPFTAEQLARRVREALERE